MNQLLERSRERRLPLCLFFVNYEKAFDSILLNVVLRSFVKEGIDERELRQNSQESEYV